MRNATTFLVHYFLSVGRMCVCVCESNSVPKRSKLLVSRFSMMLPQGDTGSP